jgi:hypothetical protein
MGVCGDLRASNNALCDIGNKLPGPSLIAAPNQARGAELCVGINGRPRPSVTPACRFLIGGRVFLLRPYEGSDFIALETPDPQAAHVAVMVGSANASQIFQKL